MRRPRSTHLLAASLIALAALSAPGCGSTGEAPPSGSSASTAASSNGPGKAGPASFERVREAVLRGARRDFSQGTGVGGPAFERCLLGRLGRALDRAAIARLSGIYRRPDGQPFAAQALNALAARPAASCGRRADVPELVEASRGLRADRVPGAAATALGVVYGPYLAVRCGRAGRIDCDRVGIDVVLAAAAGRVTATVGDRHLRLRTPGQHSGVPGRDWVGTFAGAGLSRPGSPFRVRGYGRAGRVWAGSPATYVPVELGVAFADGRTARARFPAVFLSPAWSGAAATRLPGGWHEVPRPITGVLYPRQVFAAATYPLVLHRRPRSCVPAAALHQMPADGVLLQVIEYSPTDSAGNPVRVPALPPRPRRFSYADASYEPFECAGPSYKFVYSQEGHALQAQVWMHRRTVDPHLRAGALLILDRFRPPG